MEKHVKVDHKVLEENKETGDSVTVDKGNVDFEIQMAMKNSIKNKKSKKSKKKLWIAIIVLVVVGIIGFMVYQSAIVSQKTYNSNYTEYTVVARDIKETLSGTGTLEPADSYTVTTLITGEVLEANFEEGDVITKDTLLYAIDSSNVATSLEQAVMSLEKSEVKYNRNLSTLDDLKIKATDAGKITELSVEVGDRIDIGSTIATIMDSEHMELTAPFTRDDAEHIKIGDAASVTITGSYETLSGVVTEVSTLEEVTTGNMIVKKIKVEVGNPGAISSETTATVMVGDYACTAEGNFDYKSFVTVIASTTGEVQKIDVIEGDTVANGDVLVTLTNDSLLDAVEDAEYSIKDAQLSLDSQQKQLEDYQILSPIAGTIVEKNVKKGDTLSSNVVLCTIFDLSYLTTTLSVDELDIGKVRMGQTVEITVDAVVGKSYVGTITKININGTTASGVTSYPVTVRIDETDGLLPGMNADFEVVVVERKSAVSVPINAVERGNQILIKISTPTTDNVKTESKIATDVKARDTSAPEGFEYRQVVTGISDEDFIEIMDGLSEGETIAIRETVVPVSRSMFSGPPQGGGRIDD